MANIGEQIKDSALRALEKHPEGLRFSELRTAISHANNKFNSNTINGNIWNLE